MSLVQLKHDASILGLFRETGPTGIYIHRNIYTHTHIYIHIHIYVHIYKHGEREGDSDWG